MTGGASLTRSNLRDIRMRLWFCVIVIFLSVPSLNPVKLIGEVIGFPEESLGILGGFAFLYIIYANGKDLSYYVLKIFFYNILNIFFSSIEVLGRENIPQHGPVIFSGNHMNQFVDGGVALITCPHKLNFLVAASSFKMFIIGHFARLLNALPVHRPIDNAKKGKGKIYFDGLKCHGVGTEFSKIDLKDKIRPNNTSNIYKIVSVESDTMCILGNDKGDPSPLEETVCNGVENTVAFDTLSFVDQSGTFVEVHKALQKGESIIIFPEGGSHDNTDLLPLKVGVASIAFGTLSDGNTNVSIIPFGLNYFQGHRFRGKVVVEYGEPIHITKELAQKYKENRRGAYQDLLSQVAVGMRSTLVTAENYDELKIIHTARRLYQRAGSSATMTTKKRQDLARRFSIALRIIKERYTSDTSTSKFPEDLKVLQEKLEEYQETLTKWGIYDYQVNQLDVSFSKSLYVFLHGLIIFLVASIPSLLLNAPVGVAAKFFAEKKRTEALAKSRVKVAATDVLQSNKIIFSIAAVPALWITYACLLYFFSNWQLKTIVLCFLCCPLFSYIGIKSVEASMIDLKDLRPAFLRLFPSFREHAIQIPVQRAEVQKLVRAAVKKYGPSMGPLYFEKEVGVWYGAEHVSLERSSSETLLNRMAENNEETNDSVPRSGSMSPGKVVGREGARVPSSIEKR